MDHVEHDVSIINNASDSSDNPLQPTWVDQESYLRDLWMLQTDPTLFHSQSRDEFIESYDPSVMIPSPELERSILFAGHETFEDLQSYTYERVEDLFTSLGVQKGDMELINVYKTFGIVERLMENAKRRTDEPAVSHIYRNVLRMIEFIEGYNEIYAQRGEPPIFTADIAEFYICAANMHDFLEDAYITAEGYHKGAVSLEHPIDCTEGGIFFYRYNEYLPESQQNEESNIDITEVIEIDFDDEIKNDLFVRTLNALNANGIPPMSLMTHLSGEVTQMQSQIEIQNTIHPLYAMAAYLIKCGDRLDNNATYFYKRKDGEIVPAPSRKVYEKAHENLYLFADVMQILRKIGGHQRMTDEELALLKPFYLKYDPARWSKHVLSGVPINRLYRPNEKGIGIAKIL